MLIIIRGLSAEIDYNSTEILYRVRNLGLKCRKLVQLTTLQNESIPSPKKMDVIILTTGVYMSDMMKLTWCGIFPHVIPRHNNKFASGPP